MESPGVGKTGDVIAETGKCDGRRRTDKARVANVVSDSESAASRTTSLRRIDIAPASGDDVVQSPEPASNTIHCSWKPMEPGYSANAGAAVLIERTVEVEDFGHDASNADDADNSFRLAIPIMSRSVAVVCAVCNVLSPGLG